jgi:hypothetical protein
MIMFVKPSPNWYARTAVWRVMPARSEIGANRGIVRAAFIDPEGMKKLRTICTPTRSSRRSNDPPSTIHVKSAARMMRQNTITNTSGILFPLFQTSVSVPKSLLTDEYIAGSGVEGQARYHRTIKKLQLYNLPGGCADSCRIKKSPRIHKDFGLFQ